MPPKQINPPSAPMLISSMAAIVERRNKTKQNLEKAKKDVENMRKKNGSSVELERLKTKVSRLESELDGWPATYETEFKRWLLAQPTVADGTTTVLPQEIKNEISKYLQTPRIRQIEAEVLKKK
ncbi:hypothetical protein B0I37DRAFT_443745 [Chaetomium sp. MPI-CAGE-AT-0009]|nr:hypothetical protein B0I37DRAFT_443745 [Chaetomium sp. MPI-CAGE-AT-0009]